MIVSNKYQSEGIEPFIVFLPKCFSIITSYDDKEFKENRDKSVKLKVIAKVEILMNKIK